MSGMHMDQEGDMQQGQCMKIPLLLRLQKPVRCTAERQALFNRIAPVYDKLNELLSLGRHRVWMRMSVSWSGLLLLISQRSSYRLLRPASTSDRGPVTRTLSRKKALEEMYRVLKPGTKVSVLDFNKSTNPLTSSIQDWMIDNVVVPVARGYGLASEYQYLKNSIKEYLTGSELEKLALQAGFSKAKHYEISTGFMGNSVATR
ncbi:2-phytyl-1,4-beta-naphthoquinone methyltransferase, chloroplastic [Sesamum alatum]|uniref:2-phytyl-1,4-beta-naphthoquinone methyltransferase, chloroplastic n=1 Tax=Sesamum alatum TaxID=300844 RepID=A0AAE2CIX5_9LAMI|nr:2-phytyl-1,4-beta-naphthoquinone methyltransferase, chloroplastic [Sesamum alatum]